jgi:hypothetical protein
MAAPVRCDARRQTRFEQYRFVTSPQIVQPEPKQIDQAIAFLRRELAIGEVAALNICRERAGHAMNDGDNGGTPAPIQRIRHAAQ